MVLVVDCARAHLVPRRSSLSRRGVPRARQSCPGDRLHVSQDLRRPRSRLSAVPSRCPSWGSLSSSEPRRLPSEADHRWRYGNWSSRPARPDDHLVPVMSRSRSNLAELKCQPGTSRTSRTVPRTRPRPSVGGIAPKATSAATTHVGRLASGPNCWARGRRAPWSRSQCRPISPQAAMGGADTIWARISGSPVGRRSAADTPAQAEVMAATSTAKHDRGGESITAVAEAAAR